MSIVIPESDHATALKQVWLHEHPDTIPEERSCVNPMTGCVLPTDIVNHRLEIAIEVQSAFHDVDSQKIKDAIKKKFWVDNGYDFYAVDHRDYTILEMIQIFFPYIDEIPDYVDVTKKSISVVQLDLYKNFVAEYDSIESAEYQMGFAESRIRNTLKAGRNYCGGYYWVYKEDYDSGQFDIVDTILRAIVQLDCNGNFIAEYPSIAEASRATDIKEDNIRGCKKAGRTFSCGFHWIYKDDYESGNYSLYKGNPRNTPISIVCLDTHGNFVSKFDSIKDGGNAMNVKPANIRQCMSCGRTYSGGYHWIKEEDYINGNYSI